jgi:hypothetical protein
VVKGCCEKAGLERIAPHDLRRTCAKLCHSSGGELEQIQFLLGHASVQTTERYLGCKQNLGHPVNDRFSLIIKSNASANPPVPEGTHATGPGDTMRQGDSDHAQHTAAAAPQRVLDHARDALVTEGEENCASSLRPRPVSLYRELEATIQEAKQMAEQIKVPDELWALERHLTQRRKEIDTRYEFKYSVVLLVLGDLLREGQINVEELQGLTEDKLRCVRNHSQHSAA